MQKIARKVKIINKKISVNNEKHEIKKIHKNACSNNLKKYMNCVIPLRNKVVKGNQEILKKTKKLSLNGEA